jgi:putative membrane protein (TIGR04086 family)
MNYDVNAASSPKNQISYARMAKSVTLGVIISLFSTVILLVVFAVIVNAAFGDPDGVLHIFTGIGAAAGALVGGFRASRLNGSNGLIAGLCTGAATSIILFIVMLFASEPAAVSVETDAAFRLVMILCNVLFACAGGVLAVNSGRNRSSRRYSPGKK